MSLRADVRKAIESVWPDGVVELSFDRDESYFYELQATLQRALYGIRNAHVIRERTADGGPVWVGRSDPEDDPPDDFERERSYHLFFVSPTGKDFIFETEAESFAEPDFESEEFEEDEWEDSLTEIRVSGTGRTGWVVAVSLVAPFAVIELNDVIDYEDGSTELEIESYVEMPDGARVGAEEHFREIAGKRAYRTLMSLRTKIAGILEKSGIAVLQREEWQKPVPRLRGGEDTIMAIAGNRSACWTPSSLRKCSGRAYLSPAAATR